MILFAVRTQARRLCSPSAALPPLFEEILNGSLGYSLKSRVDGFAFHGEDAEDAFVDAVEGVGAGEAFERFDAEGEFVEGEGALARLSAVIGLESIPERIECFDNSHMMGRDTVSGMVVFEGGKPSPKEYRRFRVKTETEGDDYLAMRETLTRRFERAKSGDERFAKLPDLLVVDGGRGQLNVALEVLREYGLEHIPSIGLAERNEEIILPNQSDPLALERRDPALHMLQRIRDEAHRFAISYHRSLRSKTALYSELDEIEGVGAKRKRLLFDAFVSRDAISKAGLDELMSVKGITRPVAQAVYDHFNKNNQ